MASDSQTTNCGSSREDKEPWEASDMQKGCMSDAPSTQQPEYFVFKAQGGDTGTGNIRRCWRRHRNQGQGLSVETPEEAANDNTADCNDQRAQVPGRCSSAPAAESAQIDWSPELPLTIHSSATRLPQQSLPEPSSSNRAQPPEELSLYTMLLLSRALAYVLPVHKQPLESEEVTAEGQKENEPVKTSQAATTGEQEVPAGEEEQGNREVEAGGMTSEAHNAEEDAVHAEDKGDAAQSQLEEQPLQLHQEDDSEGLQALEEWEDLLDPIFAVHEARSAQLVRHHHQGPPGQPSNEYLKRKQKTAQLHFNKAFDKLKESFRNDLHRGFRLPNLMNTLISLCQSVVRDCTPRQLRRIFRRVLAQPGVRRALRACFATRDDRLWQVAACIFTVSLGDDFPLLHKRLTYVRNIIDRFDVTGVMFRTGSRPLQRQLAAFFGSITFLKPLDGSPSLDPLFDVMIKQMVAPLTADVIAGSGSVSTEESYALARACTFLTYCVRQHGEWLRPFLFRHGAPEAVARLAGRAEPHLAVAAVDFLRACVEREDLQYLTRLTHRDLFAPAITALRAAAYTRSDVTDEVQELLAFVIKEDVDVIICHIRERFGQSYFPGRHALLFDKLRLKYQEILTRRS